MFEMAIAGVGLATSLAGSLMASTAASSYYKGEQNIGQLELQVNDQRKLAMEVDARRRQLEVVRNNQKARALSQTSATSQGAQMGTGLQGSYGGISGQSNTNLLGVNQNLEIGRNIFGIDTKISEQRIANSGFQSQMNQGQGEASIGNTLMSSSGKAGSILQSLFGGSSSGGSPSSSSLGGNLGSMTATGGWN